MRKASLLHELHYATPQWIPTITPTMTYYHSPRRLSCAEYDVEDEAWSSWFMAKEKTNRNRTEVHQSHRWGLGSTAKRSCKRREDEIVFLFYELKKKQNLKKKRRERRWEISGSYRLCSSYTLVSSWWNILVKVKRKYHRSRNCFIVI